MIMTMKKQLWSLARTFLPLVGFAVTCLGAYLMSLQTEGSLLWGVIPAYILMGLGSLAVMGGVFWAVCHSMKSKMYRRRGERHIEVYAIERPSFFPPSYEESQYSQATRDTASEVVVEVDGGDVMILAPPLYSTDSSEAPDCTWSWERPPRYSQVERALQGEEERRVASSVP
ncbi:transmembrane protein 252-like [Labrus mixtus]|uniref:transmembrane protein 252-like n=1 Tax=Labrus mixtus TaxID=508554 RepID=UPI0029C08634|nr:transmembrane protein 252-like [Labrus mixtus]